MRRLNKIMGGVCGFIVFSFMTYSTVFGSTTTSGDYTYTTNNSDTIITNVSANSEFLNYECKVELHRYQQTDRIAIILTSAVTNEEDGLFEGEQIATATVNMPEIEVGENQVLIKDYSENVGMVKALQKAGLVMVDEKTKAYGIGSGFVAVVDMSPELIEAVKNEPRLQKKQKATAKP